MVTTGSYGDRFPVTGEGRLVGVLLMVVRIAGPVTRFSLTLTQPAHPRRDTRGVHVRRGGSLLN
jgi:hypothetical protein